MAIDTSIKKGYNQTDLSVIPEGWETQSLEGIADPKASICYGIVQVGSFASNGIPVLAIKNLNTDYFTNVHRSSPAIEALYVRSRVCPGDVLISVKGTIGRIGIVPQHFVGNISRDLARLRLTERNVPEFWYQMLQSESTQRRLGLATVGTTRMELSIGILKQIRMLCPPKVEQCAIARVLNDVDALITSLDKLIAKKRDIKQATMQQLLTGKMRLPGFSKGARQAYKQTEAGEIPEDWEVKKLGDVADFLDGRRRPINESDRAEMRGEYPYYGASGIVDYVNDYIFDEELILLGEDGENILSRNCKLAFQVSGKIWVNNHAHVLRPKANTDASFLTEYLESLDYEQYNTGTAQPKLNKKVCLGIIVFSPPLLEQQAISTVLSDMDAEIAALEQKRDKIRVLKQGMMQELLTGKTRLL